MKKYGLKSLSVRLPLLFVASMLAIMGVMIPVVYQRFYNRMIDQYTRLAEGVTQLAVNAVDGDRTEEYIEKNFSLPEYVDTVNYLYTLRDNFPDVLYLYVYRFEEDGGHVVIDLDADWWENGEGYAPGYLWSLDEIEEPYKSHLSEVMAGKQIAGYSEQTREDGYLFTYTRPIFRSDGSYACTACVDFSLDYLSGMDKSFTFGLSAILLGISALVLLFDIFIVGKKVTQPINALSNCAAGFAYNTEADRKNNIALLDQLNIHTGDEIEDVYHVLQSVTRDSLAASECLSSAQTDLKDRDGMITAMAADYRSIYHVNLDRDECTCYRANARMVEQMWPGKVFRFSEAFRLYAEHAVAESDRKGFLEFIDPENIRKGLEHETMLAHRYLTVVDGAEQYEMLRIAGVRTPEEREDHIVHAIGAGFSRKIVFPPLSVFND